MIVKIQLIDGQMTVTERSKRVDIEAAIKYQPLREEEFRRSWIDVPEDSRVVPGMLYDPETGEFSYPPAPPPEERPAPPVDETKEAVALMAQTMALLQGQVTALTEQLQWREQHVGSELEGAGAADAAERLEAEPARSEPDRSAGDGSGGAEVAASGGAEEG